MKQKTNTRAALFTALLILFTTAIMAQGLEGNKDKEGGSGKSKSTGLSSDYNWGVGIRLGDPSGITIKKYTGTNAWELSFGRSHIIGRNGYWDSYYSDYWKDKYYKSSYDKYDYLGYTRSAPIGFQLHYLWQKTIPGVEGLGWYYGIGAQLSFQTITYEYRYKFKGGDWIYDNNDTFVDLDLGADGVAGLEYTFSDVPISAFLDLTMSMEIYDNPFIFWFQGGIGARYNF